MRIGFDVDGVLADFASEFRAVEDRLFPDAPADDGPYQLRQRQDAVWAEIRSITDFWVALQPVKAGAVRRVHELTLRHRWEVFFITQRPATRGETVQRQTQRWLVAQGFDLPSVLVIAGSRGAAAAALRLDYHVDDSIQNCLDVLSAAGSKAILIAGRSAPEVPTARKLGMARVPSIVESLDLLSQVSAAESNPTLLNRLATLAGWK